MGNYDPYDLGQNFSALFPPEYYVDYLHTPAVMKQIGAKSNYSECPDAPYYHVINTGDVCILAVTRPPSY